MPVLAVGGATSTSGRFVEEMLHEVAENVVGLRIDRAAYHFVTPPPTRAATSGVDPFLGRRCRL